MGTGEESPASKARSIVSDDGLSRRVYGEQTVRGYGVYSNRALGAKTLLKYDVELMPKIETLAKDIKSVNGKVKHILIYRSEVPSMYRKRTNSPVKKIIPDPKTGELPLYEGIRELLSDGEPFNLKAHPAIPKSKVCKTCRQEVTDFGAIDCEENGHYLEEIEDEGEKKTVVPLTQIVMEIVWESESYVRQKDCLLYTSPSPRD